MSRLAIHQLGEAARATRPRVFDCACVLGSWKMASRLSLVLGAMELGRHSLVEEKAVGGSLHL